MLMGSSPRSCQVHRIGRTGRDGVAITLAEPREPRPLRNIEFHQGEARAVRRDRELAFEELSRCVSAANARAGDRLANFAKAKYACFQ